MALPLGQKTRPLLVLGMSSDAQCVDISGARSLARVLEEHFTRGAVDDAKG